MRDLLCENYFDYAAACPMLEEIVGLYPGYARKYGCNPHGTTCYNHECQLAIERSAESLLDFLKIPVAEARVIWCSGATEALNLGIRGLQENCALYCDAAAHPAMLETFKARRRQFPDFPLNFIPVDANGQLIMPEERAVGRGMLGLCLVNNESGAVQDLSRIRAAYPEALLCVDAAQAVGRIPLHWQENGLDMVVVSGRKFGGAASVGALICRKNLQLSPLIYGGGQQDGVRSGTLDTVSIALLAPTLEILRVRHQSERLQIQKCNFYLREELAKIGGDNCRIISPEDGVPDILSVCFPGYEGAVLMRILAKDYGIQLSSGSACSAESGETSHVMLGMGLSEREARGVLRISLGHDTKLSGCIRLVGALKAAMAAY